MQVTKERVKKAIMAFLVSGLPAAILNRDPAFHRESVREWTEMLGKCSDYFIGSAHVYVRDGDVMLVREPADPSEISDFITKG